MDTMLLSRRSILQVGALVCTGALLPSRAFALSGTGDASHPQIVEDLPCDTIQVLGNSYLVEMISDDAGNRRVWVTDNESGRIVNCFYSIMDGSIYINGVTAGSVLAGGSNAPRIDDGYKWTSLGSATTKITREQASTAGNLVSALIGVLCALFPLTAAQGVVAAISSTVIGAIVSSAGGCTVSYTLYFRQEAGMAYYKYVATLRLPNGVTYGPYTYYQ